MSDTLIDLVASRYALRARQDSVARESGVQAIRSSIPVRPTPKQSFEATLSGLARESGVQAIRSSIPVQPTPKQSFEATLSGLAH